MGEIFFFIKCLVLTFVFVILMQIRIGQHTLEERALQWVRTSSLTQPLQDISDGAVVAIREGWKKLTGRVSHKMNQTFNSDNWPGSRSLGVKLERSQAVLKEQAEKAKSKVREGLEHLRAYEENYSDGQE